MMNITTDQIYNKVITKERRNEYLSDTVQIIPHINNEIKTHILQINNNNINIIINEINETINNIQSQPLL